LEFKKEAIMAKEKKVYLSVDEYISSFPAPVQKKLTELRNVVKELVPQAEEKISYQMPAFYFYGNLVWFAGYAKHIGFYPGASAIHAFQSELSKYKSAKGSVQFPLGEPLPLELIKKIVKFRVEENLTKR
jgi:uncharacterized protein YdhG (YjbR/CyaY superfamily)